MIRITSASRRDQGGMSMRASNRFAAEFFLVLLLIYCFCPKPAQAQVNEIRFPFQPMEGQPIIIEMERFFGACGTFTFTSSLYYVEITNHLIRASIDTAYEDGDWNGGTCPSYFYEWQAFQLNPLPAGEYTLSIYNRHTTNGGLPSGPDLYATASFTVLAASRPNFIPSISLTGRLLLAGLLISLGVYQLRRT